MSHAMFSTLVISWPHPERSHGLPPPLTDGHKKELVCDAILDYFAYEWARKQLEVQPPDLTDMRVVGGWGGGGDCGLARGWAATSAK
jgi:hypothetical protein